MGNVIILAFNLHSYFPFYFGWICALSLIITLFFFRTVSVPSCVHKITHVNSTFDLEKLQPSFSNHWEHVYKVWWSEPYKDCFYLTHKVLTDRQDKHTEPYQYTIIHDRWINLNKQIIQHQAWTPTYICDQHIQKAQHI